MLKNKDGTSVASHTLTAVTILSGKQDVKKIFEKHFIPADKLNVRVHTLLQTVPKDEMCDPTAVILQN